MHTDTSSVVALYKGGRLPAWHALGPEEQDAYSQEHVDLMLRIAQRHHLMRLEGFRLLAPQRAYERFWTIEFPSMHDARAWIEAEMATPYGRYGYYEYDLATPQRAEELNAWVAHPVAAQTPASVDPRHIPVLATAKDSIVVLRFERWQVDSIELSADQRGEGVCEEQMRQVARQYSLMRLECHALLGPRDDWHRTWIAEFPDLEGAEAWIDALVQPPHGHHLQQHFHLARKWAPEYFAAWVAR